MLKFSAGFTNINPNFVIQNIKACNETCEPIFSVLNNILQRGCPTIPSRQLKEKFGNPKTKQDFQYLYNFSNCCWDFVIKGGHISNPALDFYKNTLTKILGEKYAKTFIPECSLADIIEEFETNKNVSENVDFYSPLYNAVIEIDGEQHSTDKEQTIKDLNRDKLLERYNIDIIRISTGELTDYSIVKLKLTKLKINSEYKNYICNNQSILDLDKYYLTAIRIDMLLLSLYKNKYIKLKDKDIKINIFSADSIKKEIFDICIKDFYTWLENICNLQNIDFTIPNIQLNVVNSEQELSKQQGFNIYISLFEVYSQITFSNIFYIKNDFFLYEDNIISTQRQFNAPSSFLYKKNYFTISCQDIQYKLNETKHKDSLKFLLSNVSNIYEEFRENQLDIIIECLNNTSVIGVLPTGAGKSLCYQFSALLIPAATLVVAPLQLLMVDQYNNIKEKFGISNATLINSSHYKNIDIFRKTKSLITIISPERFFSEKFSKCLFEQKVSVGFVVIDEAHCLSEWGHDFRTSYLCLSHNLEKYLPSKTFLMALTGTASHRVFEDIDCEFQNFKKKKTKAIFADSMRRDNLTIYIERPNDKYKQLIDNITPTLIGVNHDKTLVFTKKKKSFDSYDSACITLVETIKHDYDEIIKNKDSVAYYAGGEEITNYEKEQTLEDFKNGKLLIVFATKAFGMGVDVPDLRKTIHYGLPSSFESLYQQFGRAGRDGKPSKCYVYYNKENEEILKKFFSYPLISISEMKENLKYLDELSTNFYFVQSANLDIDIEIRLITRLLQGIKTRNKNDAEYVDCKTIIKTITKQITDKDLLDKFNNANNARVHIEKALYRLFLLGEIEMWNLVYDSDNINPTFNNLKTTKLSEEEKLIRLQSHIQKYQTNFIFEQENTFENRLKFLVQWANKNYLQERIQTMKTLYEQCEQYIDSNQFMTYISNYFSNDPIYVRLIDKNVSLKEWIEALKTHPEKTKARIARLLESYDKIVPLNYVSGITRLRLDDFDNPDGKRRLNLALEEICKFSQTNRNYLLNETLSLLSKKHQEIFIECWLNYCNEDASYIYENTNSPVCENYLIIDFVNELIKIGEKLDDRL